MPVSKEPGVDLYGWQSGDSVGLPIKKRKYHMVRSPSPPQISSLLPKEPNLPPKDQFISELETPASVIDVAPKGYSLKDGIISTDRHMNLRIENSVGLNLRQSDVPCSSSSNAELAFKTNLIPKDELTFQQVEVNSGLLFAQKEPLQQRMGEEMSEVKSIMSSNSVCTEVLGNTELLLALKESLGFPTECKSTRGSCSKEEKLCQPPVEGYYDMGPHELRDFTLHEEQINVHTNGNITESKMDCDPLNESRSHWDLNTTMDAWEGQTADGMNGLDVSKTYDIKSELVLKERADSHLTSKKCLRVDTNASKQSYDLLSCLNREPSPRAKLIIMKGESDHSKSEKQMLPINMNSFVHKPVKSEQLELGDQGDFRTVENHCQLVHFRTPKPEVSDWISQEALPTVDGNKLVNPRGVKSEAVNENNQMGWAGEGILPPEIHELNPQLPIKGEVTDGTTETIKGFNLIPKSAVPDAKGSLVADHIFDSAQMTCSSVAYLNYTASIDADGILLGSTSISGASRDCYDKEINVSSDIHERGPCNNKHESDSSPNGANVDIVVGQTNDNDNRKGGDFEDGEFRELWGHDTSVDVVHEEGEIGQVSNGGPDNKEVDGSRDPKSDGVPILSHVESSDCTAENLTDSNSHCTGVHDSTSYIEKIEESSATAPRLKKCLVSAVPSTGPGKKRCSKVISKTSRDCAGQKEHGLKSLKSESIQEVRASTSHETVTDDSKEKIVENLESVEGLARSAKVNHSKFSKRDPSIKVDKETRINHSRIINLPQARNGTSPGRTRSIPDVRTVSCAERGRFPHKSYRTGESHPSHPQGSRDESFMDGHRKLERNRNIDRLAGNSRLDFMHMKRRADNGFNTLQCDWDSDHEFSSGCYSNSTGIRGPRANIAMDLECNGPAIAPQGSVINPGKAWRRRVHEDLESFHHPPFRRQSPDGREGPMPLHLRMVRTPLRVNCPDRCISRGDTDMVVARHEEKLMRDLPDEMMDPLPPHSRLQYQRVQSPFIRRERSFSPIPLRGPLQVPRICSKSPRRSRTPSPSSWPSPMRSLDQFDGHPELFLRRSPPVYRGERIGSPFGDPMMVRRRGSPPHIPQLSNEMRTMGPLREHDRPRAFILNRSQSGRVLQRNTGRFDFIDSQEGVEGDEYFGPLHSGQFHELVGNDCVNDRRKCPERYGPIRSFRPNDFGIDVERFHHLEDGPRPNRFFPGADAELHEKGYRGSPRDFEARIINQLGNPKRPIRVDEQEDNERFRVQERREGKFNGTAGLKRRRF